MEKEISIILKIDAWNLVLNALAQRPYGEVAGVVEAMARQIEPQARPQATTSEGQPS